jgi:signal transduction histidine kinase
MLKYFDTNADFDMIDKHDELYSDFEAVKNISIVPTMLDVVCRITGMGFAAVARVTEDRWLACSVRDDVNFGLAEGGELKIETTICNEIRDNRKEVIIDHVDLDPHFKDHHTPKMYGLQSYISFPIILKSGLFFGTLCAIDSKPATVNKPEIRGTFKLFADLLAFHLDGLDLLIRSKLALKQSHRALSDASAENQAYRKISDHNIQEQVRKIAIFSDILSNNIETYNVEKVKNIAHRINSVSQELSSMIQHVKKFSGAQSLSEGFEKVDLNKALSAARADLDTELLQKKVSVKSTSLPVIAGIELQLKELFFQLINHALIFSNASNPAVINISSQNIAAGEIEGLLPEEQGLKFTEITIEEDGLVKDEYYLKNIFDIFLHLSEKQSATNYGNGLAYCRKIVQNHGGMINAKSLSNKGIAFSVILPIDRPAVNAEATHISASVSHS